MERRCGKVKALEEETTTAAVLFSQALGQGLQHFLGEKVSVKPGVSLTAIPGFTGSHTHSYPLPCIQWVAEEGLHEVWGQGRQQL